MIILYTVIILGLLALVLAVILYVIAQKFKVEENPLIDEVVELLPGANCGGCGFPGCGGFASICVTNNSLDGMFCPAGGNETMKKIASLLGLTVEEQEPKVAVIRCNGSKEKRPIVNNYDGIKTCAIAHATFGGETGCIYGCLGFGDCANACSANGITMDEESGLPIFDEKSCTSCGGCVKTCPRGLIELRNQGKNNRRVYVACRNSDKGADAKKACGAACIGCGICMKNCPFEAISLNNNLAYIDFTKCKLCRKCTTGCPTGAILEVNFPPRKSEIINENIN
ncbi:MAG: RnfABCDGE type electron transport complex subunit B [Bacteroidales bacterium]|jgi:RnfABCDGE-type electron transport complex B subunit|nr:RnfABCDGE type electron transport complex subunit B [Bacteroidales bacterium]